MDFSFTEDQLALRDAVRDLLARECPAAAVRDAWNGGPGYEPSLWAHLGAMGVFGVLAAEPAGGLGLSELELVLIMEETGRAAMPGPIVEHAAVAVPILAAAGGAVAEWLGRALGGDAVVTVGSSSLPGVTWAGQADLVLLEHGGHMCALHHDQIRSLTELNPVDRSRRIAAAPWDEVAAAGVLVEPVDLLAANNRGVLSTAAQLVGLAAHLIETTAEYAKQRHQFGVPIGSYQAVKHHLANAYLALEFARPALYRAAYSVAHGEPGATCDTSFAKVFANRAGAVSARVALQCHGAIGYSFEHDLHLWMKRVWALQDAWGSTSFHREVVARSVLGAP